MYSHPRPGRDGAAADPFAIREATSSFVDARGRPWEVTITAAVLERVRERTGIDLAAVTVAGGSLVEELTPVERLFHALHVIIEPQLEARSIGPREYFPELFVNPAGPVARRVGRLGTCNHAAAEAAARALARALAALYPGTVHARALAIDEGRSRGGRLEA